MKKYLVGVITRIFILLYILGFLSMSIFFLPMNKCVSIIDYESAKSYEYHTVISLKPIWTVGVKYTQKEKYSPFVGDGYKINFQLYFLYLTILFFTLLFVRLIICMFAV